MMAKKIMKLSTLLQLLQCSVFCQQPICQSNSRCACFIKNKSDIYWNVTVNYPEQGSLLLSNMYMQTKGEYSAVARWQNATNCIRDMYKNKRSIMCRIVKPIKSTDDYALRVVTDKFVSIARYQSSDGFYCYANHLVHNITPSAISATSLNISWDLNSWDVLNKFFSETIIEVYLRNELYCQIEVKLIMSKLNRIHTIKNLDPCHAYNICLMNLYKKVTDERKSCIKTRTLCRSIQQRRHVLKVEKDDSHVVMIILCLLSGLSLAIVLVYVMYRRRTCLHRAISLFSMCGRNVEHNEALLQRPFTITNGSFDDDDVHLQSGIHKSSS